MDGVWNCVVVPDALAANAVVLIQDNDIYGHVNNAHYYSYMDTVINQAIIVRGALDPAKSKEIGFCVEGKCSYKAPITYPVKL
jgi:acyl-CoA thioester hydrolase